MAVPKECKKLENEVNRLKNQLKIAQDNLKETKSSYYTGEVKDLLEDIADTTAKLKDCIRKHTPKPKPTYPQSPPYSGIPFKDPCLTIKTQLATDQTTVAKKGTAYSTNHDPDLLAEIKALNSKIMSEQGQLADCKQAHPEQAALVTNFTGAYFLEVNHKWFDGIFSDYFNGTLQFLPPYHEQVALIAMSEPTSILDGLTTVTLTGASSGFYDPGTGAIGLTFTVHADVTDDNVKFTIDSLTPQNDGTPGINMTVLGEATLNGPGLFSDGDLAGTSASLGIIILLSKHPYVA